MVGTIVNSIAIIVGCLLGLLIKGKLTEKISKTIMQGIALCVLYIGISSAIEGESTLVMIVSIAIGALIGEIIDIDKWINKLGHYLESKFQSNANDISIAKGFVSSSLLFCVGAMAIVGALESGLEGQHSTLFTKSILDFISSIIFTSSLGIGVIFSSIVVFLYQGSLTLGAAVLSQVLDSQVISNMSAVGGLLIIGLALNMLDITKIKIANLIPAILLPIFLGVLII